MKLAQVFGICSLEISLSGCASPERPFDPLARDNPQEYDPAHPDHPPLFDWMPSDWQRKEEQHEQFEKAFNHN